MNNLPSLVRSLKKTGDSLRKRSRSDSPEFLEKVATSRLEQQASSSPALPKRKRMEEASMHSTEDFPPSPTAGTRNQRPLTLDAFKEYMERDIKPTLSSLTNGKVARCAGRVKDDG